MIPWLLAMLLVLLLVTSPYPINEWSWNSVPGGNAWFLIIIAATVVFFAVKRP